MGFRGDWKAYCQVFHFVRHYNTDKAVVLKIGGFLNLLGNVHPEIVSTI